MIRKCSKCNKKFHEGELEVSHDFPKYLGGTDKEGRHLLCKECHTHYDYCILADVFYKIYKIQIPYSLDRRKYIPLICRLKREKKDSRYNIIVERVKEEFFKK